MKNVALVTGASKGIGAATAKLLAKQGYAVCVNYHHSKDNADNVVSQINTTGGHAISVKADMGCEKEIIVMFEKIDQKLGPVTALVNNAGTNGGICEVENISMDRLNQVFATNVYGTFIACREAIKRMKNNGGGSIVNVSSEAAKFGGNQITHYAASKAAINAFTIGFAREVAPFGIRVNAVSPGVIDTEMHHSSPPERIANLIKSLPMGRMGKTDEVAELIKWLISDESSYISGAIIPITGSR
ncbi:MAG: short-chain dehydrogenase/reductase SDR [uncultured bacterium]|nr:MAG: short-chain dehydrogenase/reductase SDR [uncultured bacterium]